MKSPVPPLLAPDHAARVRLSQAATRLFATKGYSATSVREIVEAARVTKPSLYYHFSSKEGIYREIVGDGVRGLGALLESARPTPGEPAGVQLRKFCVALHEFTIQRLDLVRLSYSILYGPPQGAPPFDFHAIHDEVIASIRRYVHFGVERGEFRAADEGDQTLAVLGALNVAIEIEMAHPERRVGREGLERVLDVVFRGMERMEQERDKP